MRTAAEVQFAFVGERYWSARLTRDEVTLGFYGIPSGKYSIRNVIERQSQAAPDQVNWQEIQLQRHDERWYVLFEGQPLGSFEIETDQPRNVLQIMANGGEAYFSDITAFGLERPK